MHKLMMKKIIVSSIGSVALVSGLMASKPATQNPMPNKKHTFSVEGRDFKIDGKPMLIISGEMHYPRTPRAYWRDRLKKARAMGINTICTYVFWNRHEPSPGKWDFEGDNDLVAFVKMCQEEGMFVIVRPGPYVCTEWDCGGLPGWLLADQKMVLRDNNPAFMKPAMAYLEKISSMMAPLSVEKGGPVLMLQIENEYGSFGSDKAFLRAHEKAMRKGGWKGVLFTSDGPTDRMIKGGTLPEYTATMNFGGNAKKAFQKLEEYRPGQARMNGEFWVGWFDHWLKPHHTTSAAAKAKELDWMLKNGISVNIYMFHGGTNFAYYAGANGSDSHYDSDTTSYDYSAVLTENGAPSDKFEAFKSVIRKRVPSATFGPMPDPIPIITLPEIKLTQSTNLFQQLPAEFISSKQPLKMEQLGQSLGFILYETTLEGPVHGKLKVDRIQDRGQVYIDGKQVGIFDRRSKKLSLPIHLSAGKHKLQILVENMGRVNFGHGMRNERKGLHGKVTLAGKEITDWKNFSLPMADCKGIDFEKSGASLPVLKRGEFSVSEQGDAWLNMEKWGKGVVWINGHNLGRYWSRGCQQTLYVPGCWLNHGANARNEVVVLELELEKSPTVLNSAPKPIWEVRADDTQLTRKKGQNLDLQGVKPVHQAEFAAGDTWQTVKFDKIHQGRYLALEALSAQNGDAHAAITELEILDEHGKMIPRDQLAVIYADSEEVIAEAGSANNVIDNQPTTYWHTQWKDKSPKYPHAIVLDLGKERKISGFRYLPRPNSVNGRIKQYKIYLNAAKFKGL